MANPEREPRWVLPALLGVFLFALLIRALGFEHVFTEEGVVFAPADSMYHMRRAYYSFVNFPNPLLWDPYLNYPGGVAVPWPPLFDLIIDRKEGTLNLDFEDEVIDAICVARDGEARHGLGDYRICDLISLRGRHT